MASASKSFSSSPRSRKIPRHSVHWSTVTPLRSYTEQQSVVEGRGATVDAVLLKDAGLIPDFKQPVKILGNGALTKKLTVVAGWYSKAAHEKIGAAGGTAQNAKGEAFAFPKPKSVFVPREGAKKGKKAAATEEPAAAAPAAPAAALPDAWRPRPGSRWRRSSSSTA